MSLSVMKSPSRQDCARITAVDYKCEDCGDVSQNLASLSLHRSVCQGESTNDVSNSQQVDKNSDLADKTDQIAESCECPKCGEQLLLLRQHSFNCLLCEFQDTDQESFFVHLKEHYELKAGINVDPGSLIIEQVIDDSNVLNDQDEESDRDDPEYIPDNDVDDSGDEVETKTKPKFGILWRSPSASEGSRRKKLNFVKSSDKLLNKDSPKCAYRTNCDKSLNLKMGITWHTPVENGTSKSLRFVKTPVMPRTRTVESNWSPLSGGSLPKNKHFEKKLCAPSNSLTTKKESGLSENSVTMGPSKTTKWVRLEDIKYVGSPMGLGNRIPWTSPKYGGQKSPSKCPQQESRLTGSPPKQSRTINEPVTDDPPSIEDGLKKRAPKKCKEKTPKPPPERKIPVCGICKKVFSGSQSLKHHLKIHTGEKNYSCEQCGKSFTQWSTCQQHIISLHSGIKKYTCEYCGACFARSSGLSQHRRIHTGEILHRCNICDKGFRAKSYLDRHRTLHTGEKRFKCEFCMKNFRTSTDMKRHRNSIHFGLGNVSLTVAKELLLTKMDGLRTTQRPITVERLVNDSNDDSDESEEVVRATELITESHYEL